MEEGLDKWDNEPLQWSGGGGGGPGGGVPPTGKSTKHNFISEFRLSNTSEGLTVLCTYTRTLIIIK